VLLADHVAGLGFFHAVFDDEAAAPPSGLGVHSGSLEPTDALSAFDGKPAAGQWHLVVEDTVSGASGALRSVSLAFNGMTFAAMDLPATLAYPGFTSLLGVPVDVKIADAEVSMDLDDSWMLDLNIRLVSPLATHSKLFNAFGAPSGLHGTSFDDEADVSVDNAGGTATGRFRTATTGGSQPLSLLDGESSLGTWELRAIDTDPFDGGGHFDAWSLHLVPAGPCADVAASASSYGSGVAGTLGAPTLTPVFQPDLGQAFQLQVSNSLGAPQQGVLFVGLSQAAIPGKGGTLLVQPLLQVPFTIFNPVGVTFLAFLPSDAALCGTHLFVQSLQQDPGAPKGVAFSAGLELVFGS
jgi:subtilisin-like proprotein convertase family protein